MVLRVCCFLIFVLYIPVAINAQSIIKKNADKYYNQLAYIDAVEFYEKLVNSKLPQEDDLRKISYSYMQLFNYDKAEIYWTKLLQFYPNTITENDLENYIQTLKYNKQYDKVESVLILLETKNKRNSLLSDHKKKPYYLTDLKYDSVAYFIKNLEEVNTRYAEFTPVFYAKQNKMLFASNRRNTVANNKKFAWDDSYFIDIYQASKIDSLHFEYIKTISSTTTSKYHDGPVAVSENGNILLLTRSSLIEKNQNKQSNAIINLKLYFINFDSIKKEWEEPIPFEYNSNYYSVGHATLNKEGNVMYFVSDMPGGFGQSDIYVSKLINNKWTKPENVGNIINTSGREMFPYYHENGTLFFATDGRAGLGGLDIYFTPISFDNYFEPQNLGYPLNTNADEFGIYVNEDLATGYFSSNRFGGLGKDDIYYFRSNNPFTSSLLTGIIYDDQTKEIIPRAKIYLYNKTTNTKDSILTDSTGRYIYRVDKKQTYILTIKGNGKYYQKIDTIKSITDGDNNNDLYLIPKHKIQFHLTDNKTNKPLSNVLISILDKASNENSNYKTNENGYFSTIVKNKTSGDVLNYQAKFEKEDYITILEDVDITLDSNAVIELSNQLEFKMQKIAKGVDLASAINLKPIYFDLAKWNIRPDAAIELNKMVRLMLDNPTIIIELGSHTDCRSSDASNLKLSSLRAKSSVDYMVSKGINKNRMTSKGYGESKPISLCACEGARLPECSEEQHQANRRTEFIIVKY